MCRKKCVALLCWTRSFDKVFAKKAKRYTKYRARTHIKHTGYNNTASEHSVLYFLKEKRVKRKKLYNTPKEGEIWLPPLLTLYTKILYRIRTKSTYIKSHNTFYTFTKKLNFLIQSETKVILYYIYKSRHLTVFSRFFIKEPST